MVDWCLHPKPSEIPGRQGPLRRPGEMADGFRIVAAGLQACRVIAGKPGGLPPRLEPPGRARLHKIAHNFPPEKDLKPADRHFEARDECPKMSQNVHREND